MASTLIGWQFLGQWFLATVIGFVGGGYLSGVIEIVSGIWGTVLGFVIMATILGLAQWFVLRTQLAHAIWWIPMTIIGGGLGGSASSFVSWQLVFNLGERIDFIFLYGTLRGISLGLAQWFVLKNLCVEAKWWLAVNAVAWCLGLLSGVGIMRFSLQLSPITAAVTYSAITGLGMVWLLRLRKH